MTTQHCLIITIVKVKCFFQGRQKQSEIAIYFIYTLYINHGTNLIYAPYAIILHESM